MQNRIEELAQNCFEYYEGTLDGDVVEFNYQQFAELVIKECINIANHVVCDEREVRCIDDVINEHFEIKE